MSLATLVGMMPTRAAPPSGGYKCWTNKEGVYECGNQIPPEYAYQEHKVVSSSGITISRVPRSKTKEEVERERLEQEQLAAVRGEQERIAKEQEIHDRMLLDTFAGEKDLMLARDDKLQAINARVIQATKQIEFLEKNLLDLQWEAAEKERAGRAVSEELQQKIKQVTEKIKQNHHHIALQKEEQGKVRAEFEGYLARFRELKGMTLP